MSKTVKIGEYTGEIVSEKYNPLIKRKEVIIRIGHIGKSTPSRGLIRSEASKIYSTEIEKVYVRKMETEYGLGATTAYIHIYDDVDRAKKFEPEHIIKRNEYAMQALEFEKMLKQSEATGGGEQ